MGREAFEIKNVLFFTTKVKLCYSYKQAIQNFLRDPELFNQYQKTDHAPYSKKYGNKNTSARTLITRVSNSQTTHLLTVIHLTLPTTQNKSKALRRNGFFAYFFSCRKKVGRTSVRNTDSPTTLTQQSYPHPPLHQLKQKLTLSPHQIIKNQPTHITHHHLQ